MPFGLDLKSIIVGILIAYFLIPWISALFTRNNRTAPATA